MGGFVMLLGGSYRFRAGVEEGVGLKRFQAWAPPEGFAFLGHWARADGMGGMFVAEAESAAAAFEATTAFSDLMEFELAPILDIMESLPISAKNLAWRDSVG
jgi:Protein of unknown function (DUF3303)